MDEKTTQAPVPAELEVLSDDELAACAGGAAGDVIDAVVDLIGGSVGA